MDVTTLSSVAVDDIPVKKISLEQCHRVTTKMFTAESVSPALSRPTNSHACTMACIAARRGGRDAELPT